MDEERKHRITPPERVADTHRRSAPSAMRNREPMLAVLRRVMPEKGGVLEIASGTGEHAAYFAPRFPGLSWQPSDTDPTALPSIAAWVADTDAPNLRPPVVLDVTADPWPVEHADVIVCCNMIHIAPWAAARGLLAGAGRILAPGGVLYLYGPYRVEGRPTAPSNEAFDRSLRSRNPDWGVRRLDDVAREAAGHGLVLAETVDMPADNLSVISRKEE